MNGIIFCVCLTSAIHFSSIDCSEVMSKRTQTDSGEERVTAKSKPMMNLVSRWSERTPVALSSIASESPGKTIHESQTLLSPQIEKYDRTVRPVVCAHSSSNSEWNIDKTWSSQEWKSDELMGARTVRPVGMETFIFDWWRRIRQSLARKGLRIFIFCVTLWKDEREPHSRILSGRTS